MASASLDAARVTQACAEALKGLSINSLSQKRTSDGYVESMSVRDAKTYKDSITKLSMLAAAADSSNGGGGTITMTDDEFDIISGYFILQPAKSALSV